MRSFIATALLAASTATFVSAQLSACGTKCIAQAQAAAPDCSATDYLCLCKSTPYATAFGTCLQTNCTPADISAAATLGTATCQALGVTIAASGSAAATSAAASGTAAGAASAVSSVVSSVKSSVGASSSAAAASASKAAGAGSYSVQGGVFAAALTGALVVALGL
ncbi:hypothetical protein RQP46_002037 [Phenoliferia psychrophenolica]